jgi:hypothetical protein
MSLLESVARDSDDPRQQFAAATALFRLSGKHRSAVLPIYRRMAATTSYTAAYLADLPFQEWHEPSDGRMLSGLEPDPDGATTTLLAALAHGQRSARVYGSIVHDLLTLNFHDRDWRAASTLTDAQFQILRRIVNTDDVWKDPAGLWFLLPRGAKRLTELATADTHRIREEMRVIARAAAPSSEADAR